MCTAIIPWLTRLTDRQNTASGFIHWQDEIIKLHKSENPEDILAFENKEVEVIPTTEVVKKDSVVMYKGTRLPGICVRQPFDNESRPLILFRGWHQRGTMSIMTMSYIFACMRQTNVVWQRHYQEAFAGIFPEDILSQMILADNEFLWELIIKATNIRQPYACRKAPYIVWQILPSDSIIGWT